MSVLVGLNAGFEHINVFEVTFGHHLQTAGMHGSGPERCERRLEPSEGFASAFQLGVVLDHSVSRIRPFIFRPVRELFVKNLIHRASSGEPTMTEIASNPYRCRIRRLSSTLYSP